MKLFISHKSDDKIVANELYKALRSVDGVEVWVDMFELNAGDDLAKIDDSVADADAVVVLWSSSTDASDWVRREVSTAEVHQKRTIPCVLDGVGPTTNPTLANRLYIDFGLGPAVGLGHLCLAYILPTALEAAGVADGRRPSRLDEYRGHVTFCVRELILLGKNRHEIEYWSEQLIEAFVEMATWFDSILEDPGTDPTLFGVLDGSRDIIVSMHHVLLELLAEAADSPDDDDEDEDEPHVSIAMEIAQYPDDAALAELDSFLDVVTSEVELRFENDDAAELLHDYVRSCVGALADLIELADHTRSEAVEQVVDFLMSYLDETDDAWAESELGYVGLLDDAWMIHNVAYRVVEAGVVDSDHFAVDWDDLAWADELVRDVLPDDVVHHLEAYLVQLVGLMFGGLDDYRPTYVEDEDGIPRFFIPVPVEPDDDRGFFGRWRGRGRAD